MRPGTFLLNTGLYNGGTQISPSYSTDLAAFDGFSISDGTSMVLTRLAYSGPTREILGDNIPRDDSLYYNADYFRQQTITCEGIVKAATIAAMDAQLDAIRLRIHGSQKALDITDFNGTVKRFTATVDNFEDMFADRQAFHATFCPFKIRFQCRPAFGKSRDYSATTLTLSAASTNQSIYNSGTYTAQPIVTLIFDAASSVTSVTLTNTTNGQHVTYAGSIAANDVLTFDSEAKTVVKNGSQVDYSGAFPVLEVGSNLLNLAVVGTSFSAVTTLKHKSRYL